MLKQLARDGAMYAVTAALSRGLAFLLIPVYTRLLRPSDFGIIDLVAVAGSVVNMLVTAEVAQAVARFTPEAATPDERAALASTALRHTVAGYALFAAVTGVLAQPIARVLFGPGTPASLVWVATASMALGGVFLLVQNQLRWELRARGYAAASVAQAAVALGLAVVAVTVLHLGVRGALLAQAAGSLTGILVGGWLTRHSFVGRFEWTRLAGMLRFSAPLVPGSLAVFVSLYLDRIAIGQLLTLADLGVFGVAYRFASVSTLLLVGVQGALTPLVYAHHAEPGTPAQLARLLRWFSAGALTACTAAGLFAPEVLAAFTTPAYAGARWLIPALAPALLLGGMYIFAPGLAIAKRTGPMAAVSAGAAVVNVALNYALIPVVGLAGAALATLASSGTLFGLYMAASQRLYPVPHEWWRYAYALGAFAVALAVGARLPSGTAAGIVGKAVVLVAYAAAVVAAGLVRPHEFGRRGLRRADVRAA